MSSPAIEIPATLAQQFEQTWSHDAAGSSIPRPRTKCSPTPTLIKASPWYVVTADSKKHARLNCITHMLSLIPYEDSTPEPVELEPRPKAKSDAVSKEMGYVRPPMAEQTFIPEKF